MMQIYFVYFRAENNIMELYKTHHRKFMRKLGSTPDVATHRCVLGKDIYSLFT